jgi:hypothetical protein
MDAGPKFLIWQNPTCFDDVAANSTRANRGSLSSGSEGLAAPSYHVPQDKAGLAESLPGRAHELSDYFRHFWKGHRTSVSREAVVTAGVEWI